MSDKAEQFPCEVREVFSGDDLVVMVDLGVESLWKRVRVRLAGVDTPNALGASDDTEAGRVRKEIRNMTRGRRGVITVVSRNLSSWVCVLVVEQSGTKEGVVCVNDWLVGKGYVFKRGAA